VWCVTDCDREASKSRTTWPARGYRAIKKGVYLQFSVHLHGVVLREWKGERFHLPFYMLVPFYMQDSPATPKCDTITLFLHML
jgi:hypothetical protein